MQKTYSIKITEGFEVNNRYVGRFEDKMECVAAARAMMAAGVFGRYCVAVPTPKTGVTLLAVPA